MRIITALVGLPGSGKTHWAKENVPADAHYIDDIQEVSQLTDAPGDKNIYFSCPHLCDDNTRTLASGILHKIFPDAEFQWLYWENDWKAAWENVKARDDGRIISEHFLRSLAARYNPDGCQFEIYKRE